MKLSELMAATDGHLVGADCIINNIATDTRNLMSGDLFVALRGKNFDGHQFVADAQKQGAIAVVVDVPLTDCTLSQLVVPDTTLALGAMAKAIRLNFTGPLMGITGSCGKTSVKGFLRSIFEPLGQVVATQGNLNNHIGVPLTLNRLNATSKFAVVEMGASGLDEISYLADLAKPTVAVVNNVRPAHVQGFGGIEAIAREKGKIYAALNSQGTAVINYDDAYCTEYLSQTHHLRQIIFGRRRSIDSLALPYVTATHITCGLIGDFNFRLHFAQQAADVQLRVIGEHFIDNALAAAACAFAAGVSMQAVVNGLQAYAGENGRMQLIAPFFAEQQATVINDAYNANPGSVRVAIEYLAQQKQSCKILVLGDMGELGNGEMAEHTAIGFYAAEQGIDVLIAVGRLSALAAEAFSDACDGRACVMDTLDEALPVVEKYLNYSAVILLKGSRSSGVDRLISMINDKKKVLGTC